MMETTENLLEKIAVGVNGNTKVKLGAKEIDFKPPYPRIPILEAIKKNTGVDISKMDESQIRTAAKDLGIEVNDTMGEGKLIDAIFGKKCEEHYIRPTFIIDYPKSMSPLTKEHRKNKRLTERFELIINGKELANAYSELNDPIDQRKRFEDQLILSKKGDNEAMFIDQDFLKALEYGMPPTSGIGIGIDRLTMILTDSDSIQEVIFFPQMKPKQKSPSLNEAEGKVFNLLKKEDPILLATLKDKSGLSGKKWDKAIKSLAKKKLVVVVKRNESLFLETSK